MFLKSLRHTVRDERGSSLLAVIGIMAVFAIVSITIVGSTMTTLGSTTATRAGVQAQSAAEAGLDATVVGLMTSVCPALTSDNPDIAYSVVLAFQIGDDEEWHEGCPSSTAIAIRITSTGTAAVAGTAGNRSGDSRTVEAVYWAEAVAADISPDVAVHSNSNLGFGGSSQIFAGDETPSLYVKDGDVECRGSSIMRANIYVPNGNFIMGGSCQFFGDASTSGAAMLAGSSILHGTATARSIETKGSSIIKNNAWALGAISMIGSSQISGDVVAESLDIAGTALVGGTQTLSPAASRTLPQMPASPDWIDFSYEKNDWSAYKHVIVSGTCTFFDLQPIVNGLSASPGLIDARGCTNGITSIGDEILTLKNDLVIITNSVDLKGSAQFQAVASGAKLWLIMPDEVADGEPTCREGVKANIQDSVIAGTYAQALFYSPCALSFAGSAIWNGQMYGAAIEFGGSAILNHVPMTFPIAVTAGATAGSVDSGSFTLGARQSIRDVD